MINVLSKVAATKKPATSLPTKKAKPKKNAAKATKVVKKTKKKTRRGRFHTGIHNSPKCKKPISYRSGWELTVCEHLDEDPLVKEYFYEDLIIPYRTRITQQKNKKYIVDFFVFYVDGTRKIIEVKADNKVNHPITLKKTEAAIQWCSKNNAEYEIWTGVKIQQILKEQKQKHLEKVRESLKALSQSNP